MRLENQAGERDQLVRTNSLFSYRHFKTYKTYHAQPWNSGNRFMKASQDQMLTKLWLQLSLKIVIYGGRSSQQIKG